MTIWEQLRSKRESDLRLWVFLALYLGLALLTYHDFGITCDEIDNYGNGQNYLRYYFEPWLGDKLDLGGHPSQEEATHNFVYAAFLSPLNPSRSYENFHLLNLLFGMILFVAAYKALSWIYKDDRAALAGCFFIFFCPRFSGELPFNPKDVPFAILYFASLAGIYLIPKKTQGSWFQSFWIGTLIGITSSVRILGLTLLPLFVFCRLLEYLSSEKQKPSWGLWLERQWFQWGLVLFFCVFWMLMTWPYLANHPFGGWVDVFRASKDYYWNGPILFMGQTVHPSDHLGSYLPLWMAVTTPIFILVFSSLSFFIFLKRKNPEAFVFYWLLAAALILNLALYFILKPSIYNGLRHYLFLLPILAVMGAMGFLELIRGPLPSWLRKTGFAFAVLGAFFPLFHMGRLYPCSYCYFNELVGGLPGANGKFETEYWGAGLKEAAQWLDAAEPSRAVRVKTCGSKEQLTYYFRGNLEGDNEMKDPDYQVEPADPIVLAKDHLSAQDLASKTVYQVEREGVPFYYVIRWK